MIERIDAYQLKCDLCGSWLQGEYDSTLFCTTDADLYYYASEDWPMAWTQIQVAGCLLDVCGECRGKNSCQDCGDEFYGSNACVDGFCVACSEDKE